jgi:hypothetical protein
VDLINGSIFTTDKRGQDRSVHNMDTELKMTDNGGTPSRTDRRKFEYTAYVPEGRSGKDRRKGFKCGELTCYEARRIGEDEWYKISEKTAMEILVDSFDPVNPIISKMLSGEEIIASQKIYRIKK